MLVGPSGSGKSAALRVLAEALSRHTGRPHALVALDAKTMHKDLLYGSLEPTTREWTDGLFTHTLRRIIENVRGEAAKVSAWSLACCCSMACLLFSPLFFSLLFFSLLLTPFLLLLLLLARCTGWCLTATWIPSGWRTSTVCSTTTSC